MLQVVIIDDNIERSDSIKENLLRDDSQPTKVYSYNCIDNFLSSAYKFTHLNAIVLNMNLQIGIPSIEGFFIVKKLEQLRQTKILLLTECTFTKYYIFKLLCLGAASHINAKSSTIEIKNKVISLCANGPMINSKAITKTSATEKTGQNIQEESNTTLSSIEESIIEKLYAQSDTSTIASEMQLSENVIYKYIKSTYQKLQNIPIIRLPVEINSYVTEYRNVSNS